MYRTLAFTLLLLTVSLVASAHKDGILTLRADGSIPEIPAQFGAVILNVNLRPVGNSVRLKIGPHSTTVPPCVTQLIKSTSLKDLDLSGSWYHEEDRLPYYLSIRFYAPASSRDQTNDKYMSILFNLHDASIIAITEMKPRFVWFGRTYKRYSLQELCGSSGMRSNNSFKPKPLRGSA